MYPAPYPMTDLWSPGPWVEFVALIVARLQEKGQTAICKQIEWDWTTIFREADASSPSLNELEPAGFSSNNWVFVSAPKQSSWSIEFKRHDIWDWYINFQVLSNCISNMSKCVSTNIDGVSGATWCGREVSFLPEPRPVCLAAFGWWKFARQCLRCYLADSQIPGPFLRQASCCSKEITLKYSMNEYSYQMIQANPDWSKFTWSKGSFADRLQPRHLRCIGWNLPY